MIFNKLNKTNSNIALFPLKLFLLPGDYTQLHIFEERYKQLIADTTEAKEPFGIAFTDRDNSAQLGCMVEVSEVLKVYTNGSMDITVKAISLFRLISFNTKSEGKLYPGGQVKELPIANEKVQKTLQDAFRLYLSKDTVLNASLLAKDDFGLLDIANELMMSDLEKLDFVQIENQSDREVFLLNYFRYIQLLEIQENSVYNNIYLN